MRTDEGRHFLEDFFTPRSVAVVGATGHPLKVNYRLVQNLVDLGYEGEIYPVNPNAGDIFGLRAYPSLHLLPKPPDLVVTAVSARRTLEILQDCRAVGVRRVVVVSGGFSEGGDAGEALHGEIARFARESGIRILGPNTLSPIHTANRFAVSYSRIERMNAGGVSFAFQSGFYEPRLNWIFSNLGVNKILDMGNKMDINEVDALEYFSRDEGTRMLAMHLESIRGDARRFFQLLREVSSRKPVIILKSGRTPAGSLAAASHTGAIAAENDQVFDSMIRQTGALRARNIEMFYDMAKAWHFLKPPTGKRVAVIVMSGGEGVMASDACEMHGMQVAALNGGSRKVLEAIMPPWEIRLNPFDCGVCMEFHMSDPPRFFQTLSAITRDAKVDCAVVQMPPSLQNFILSSPDITEDTAKKVLTVFTEGYLKLAEAGKPVAMWQSSFDEPEGRWARQIEAGGVPVFPSAERAIAAMAAMHRQHLHRDAQNPA